jgi:hypothetical protein
MRELVHAQAQMVGPVLVSGAEPRITARRRPPAPSLPLTCASATSPSQSLAPSFPHVPGRRPGTIPGHSPGVNVLLSCARVEGLTTQNCGRKAASEAVALPPAVALAAEVLVPSASVEILLVRQKRAKLAPRRQKPHARNLILLDEPEGVAGWSVPPRPPACVFGGCQWWK